MADITMCGNKLCPIAGTCYRITAIPSDWQSIQMFEYTISAQGVVCDDHISNGNMVKTGDTK